MKLRLRPSVWRESSQGGGHAWASLPWKPNNNSNSYNNNNDDDDV